ncbi:putative methyltransferase NSUN7 isoform X1 [Stegostoma tigrinum]|uniref:putative methyltransferase NSUN7 isoform X1 n=2 Tax=Stegostoma tigrinum TaxID=3053191 RepID=UPI00202B6141|nr:putative methyltransferase NSUN7 isoform X1 [Stegostoma tigrinum]XP_048405712.1 putative methyltransferase NSUN7 isoform X1 [Stegostoma tigrinum]
MHQSIIQLKGSPEMPQVKCETSSLSEVTSEISNLDDLTISRKTRTDQKDLALHREKTGYPDYVYKISADIFQSIHVEKPPSRRLVNYEKDPEMTIPEIKDEKFQRWVYELAFSALKYQDVLEEILINSCFYPTQQISLDSTSLVVIMLYDYQDRKFQPRSISEAEQDVIPEVRKVEKSLYSFKTKLAAALARCRIKNNAISIDLILPESVRNQERRASSLPLYAWINILKTSLEEVTNLLEREGFTKVKCPQELEGLTFCEDRHCQDVLLFPTHLTAKLYEMELVTSYKMVIQDKGRSLAPHSVKVLMNMDDDIVVTNAVSRLTVAHMSTLINQSMSKVFVCGVKTESQQLELKNLFEKMGCKNIKLIPQKFTDIEPIDPRLQKVKVILLVPQCSTSGVSNPVEFILNEHGDTTLLQELSQGKVSEEKLKQLAQKQAEELVHAIKFPKVQAIVYSTCSVYAEENEEIVKPVLGKKIEGPRVQPYRLSAPVIPLCCPSEITCASDKFFKIEPSEQVNGCFIAVLTRERDPSGAVSVKDVLARAAAKGLLDGVETPRIRKKEEKRKKSKVITPKMGSFSGAQSRITEFLNEQKSITVNGTSTASQQLSRSEASATGSSIKLTQRVPIPTLPGRVKRNISNASSVGRLASRKGSVTGTKQELKLVLKPVEMLLPPVTIRYLNSHGVQNHGYNQPYLFQYHGLTSQPAFPYSRNAFVTSLGVKKQRDTGMSISRRQTRPWL